MMPEKDNELPEVKSVEAVPSTAINELSNNKGDAEKEDA